jgi:hypothetical protein
MTRRRLPRGIRNHNPGNIRHSKARWRGMAVAQTDPAFVQFDAPEFGVRALMRVLVTYAVKHGLRNVEGMITRWAPPVENDTRAYINAISRALGVAPDAPIDLCERRTMITLARAIVRHENGPAPKGYPRDWYADEIYLRAFELL